MNMNIYMMLSADYDKNFAHHDMHILYGKHENKEQYYNFKTMQVK